VQVARLVDRLGQALGRRRGPGLGAQGGDQLVALDPAGREQLDPGALVGAELAQAQLAPVGEPDQDPRATVPRRGALVEDPQPPGRHQVHEQLQRALADRPGADARRGVRSELHREHLSDPPGAGDRHSRQRRERRVDRLHRHHPRRDRRLDLGPGERGGEAAGGDLDLGQLGHRSQ